MAEKERPIRDIRSSTYGVFFDVPGSKIQNSIREKIGRLDKQVAETLGSVAALVPDTKTSISFLAAFTGLTSELSPQASQVYHLCSKLQSLTDEVAELQQIGRNLFSDEVYRLGVEELQRFGL